MDKESYSIKDFIPYLGVYIIAIGLIKLYIYYIGFGVNITNYLEISEVVNLFFDNLYSSGMAVLMGIIFFYLKESMFNSHDSKKNSVSAFEEKDFVNRLGLYFDAFKKYIYIMLLISCVSVYQYYYRGIHYHTLESRVFSLLHLVTSLFISFEIIRYYYIKIGRPISTSMFIILWMGYMFFTLVKVKTIEDVIITKENKGLYDIEISYEKNHIKGNDSLYFVGQTKGFFFFYNDKTEQSVIYSNKDVKMIKLSPKKNLLSNHRLL